MAIPATLKSWDVAVVGEIFADHVFSGFPTWPGPGEEVIAENYLRELGGGAINTACALSRLGRRVRLVGLIGEADLDWFESRLGEFGVSMEGIRIGSDGTGITVSVSTVEDRSFFTYPGVNRALPELLASPEIVADLAAARHVHFAMPLPRDLAGTLLPLLRQAGCTTSLDVGYSPGWLRDPANRSSLRDVDLFLPNAKEAALLSGDEEPSSFEAWSIGAGIGRAVMKQGASGAWIADERGLRHVPAPRIVALDSTGAGDAFDAGVIDGLLDGESIDGCVERGCICGALCTTAAGALQSLPHSPQLRTLREQTYGS